MKDRCKTRATDFGGPSLRKKVLIQNGGADKVEVFLTQGFTNAKKVDCYHMFKSARLFLRSAPDGYEKNGSKRSRSVETDAARENNIRELLWSRKSNCAAEPDCSDSRSQSGQSFTVKIQGRLCLPFYRNFCSWNSERISSRSSRTLNRSAFTDCPLKNHSVSEDSSV